MDKKRITDLIEENHVYASVLFYFGIEFYEYAENTLAEVCDKKGLSVSKLISALEQVNQKGEAHDLALISFPVDVIIAYLRHTHYLFITRKLPFIANLISNITATPAAYKSIINDLKLIFPIFIEDFVHHIHEEEDNLFSHILMLSNTKKSPYNPGALYYALEKETIQRYAIEHEIHDDEMKGINHITNNYATDSNTPQAIKVLYMALKEFEKELCVHAKVENEILFPKALVLEKEVKKVFRDKVVLN